MPRTIIFDLSEVLIAGLVGIEKTLAKELLVAEQDILPCFGGQLLEDICTAKISEDAYLEQIIAVEQWNIEVTRLKSIIRHNFHQEVEGMQRLLMTLASRYELTLLSDHAREWIAYIKDIHPFLQCFERTFFSYELEKTKKNPATFLEVLDRIAYAPEDCLFIDDNPKNIAVAESVGITGIRFVNTHQIQTVLNAHLG